MRPIREYLVKLWKDESAEINHRVRPSDGPRGGQAHRRVNAPPGGEGIPRLTSQRANRVHRRPLRCQRGAAIVILMVSLLALMGVIAVSVDLTRLFALRSELQTAADAGALAGAIELSLGGRERARDTAIAYAARNEAEHAPVTIEFDLVTLGIWDPGTRTFTPVSGAADADAVEVIAGREVSHFFAWALNIHRSGTRTRAVAWSGGGSNTYSRFLIDQELIDSDIPVIEELAERYGVESDWIIEDNDGDWFIDLPPGEILELPTGQVGDEGLFEIWHRSFEFSQHSNPSFEDFLNYNEDSNSWRYDLVPKDMLDPLPGVSGVFDPAMYYRFIDRDNCQVSPIYKNDINDPKEEQPAVNALGWRRGLLAFKIIDIGADPDGAGSVLPNIVIEVCDPTMIGLDDVVPWIHRQTRVVLVL